MSLELETKSKSGPQTAQGKAIVSRNAIKHGILATVIPEHEQGTYQEHVEAVHASYAPVGYLEQALTERIATALWRLGRVVLYESAVIREETERSLERYHTPDTTLNDLLTNVGIEPAKEVKRPEVYRKEIEEIAATLTLHRLGPEGLARREAHELQVWVMGTFSYAFDQSDYYKTAYDRAMKAINQLHNISKKEVDWLERVLEEGEVLAWDFAKASRAVELLMSGYSNVTLPKDWQEVAETLAHRVTTLTKGLERVLEQHAQIRARGAMPSPNVTQKIAKYEAHIERTLYRAMHELEAMQERRQGKATPLARVEVHGGE